MRQVGWRELGVLKEEMRKKARAFSTWRKRVKVIYLWKSLFLTLPYSLSPIPSSRTNEGERENPPSPPVKKKETFYPQTPYIQISARQQEPRFTHPFWRGGGLHASPQKLQNQKYLFPRYFPRPSSPQETMTWCVTKKKKFCIPEGASFFIFLFSFKKKRPCIQTSPPS